MSANFNTTGVTVDNLDEFLSALTRFAETKGLTAASRWLTKLNPEVDRHISMELNSCGGGYTRSAARQAVWFEFDQQPLPQLCDECGNGVAWYRATSSVMKCQSCGAANLDKKRYLDLAQITGQDEDGRTMREQYRYKVATMRER